PPRLLSKLELRDDGIPEEYMTAVVVPTLLGSVHGVEEALEHIEVQYLANRDPNLQFAILSDFTDSPNEHRQGDDEILAAASGGIKALNAKYRAGDEDVFFLFHRPGCGTQNRTCGWVGSGNAASSPSSTNICA